MLYVPYYIINAKAGEATSINLISHWFDSTANQTPDLPHTTVGIQRKTKYVRKCQFANISTDTNICANTHTHPHICEQEFDAQESVVVQKTAPRRRQEYGSVKYEIMITFVILYYNALSNAHTYTQRYYIYIRHISNIREKKTTKKHFWIRK